MSYDFELYSLRAITLPPPPTGDGFALKITGPLKVSDEDLMPSLSKIIGKKRILYQINLEGHLPDTAEAAFDSWINEILRTTKGVLVDLQQDSYQTSRTSGLLPATSTDTLQDFRKEGSISFHFLDGEAFYQTGFERFLNLIANELPEALPVRFDSVEPMQGRLSGRDFSEMISMFHHEAGLFWSAKSPFSGGSLSIMSKKQNASYHPDHRQRQNLIISKCSLGLRPQVFADHALMKRVVSFFEQACVALDVVYGQITKTDWVGPSWFWTGLPAEAPWAACLGPAYQHVWPEFAANSRAIGLHHQVSVTDRFGNGPSVPPPNLCPTRRYGTAEFDAAKVNPLNIAPDERGHYW